MRLFIIYTCSSVSCSELPYHFHVVRDEIDGILSDFFRCYSFWFPWLDPYVFFVFVGFSLFLCDAIGVCPAVHSVDADFVSKSLLCTANEQRRCTYGPV